MRKSICVIFSLFGVASATAPLVSLSSAKDALQALNPGSIRAIFRDNESTLAFVRSHVRGQMRRVRIAKAANIETTPENYLPCTALDILAKASSELHEGPDERRALDQSNRAINIIVHQIFEQNVDCETTDEMNLVLDRMVSKFPELGAIATGRGKYLTAFGLLNHNSTLFTAGMAAWVRLGGAQELVSTALKLVDASVKAEKEKRALMMSEVYTGDVDLVEARRAFVGFVRKANKCGDDSDERRVCEQLRSLMVTTLEHSDIVNTLTQ